MFLGFAQRTKGNLFAKGNLYRQMRHSKEGGEKKPYPAYLVVRKLRHKD